MDRNRLIRSVLLQLGVAPKHDEHDPKLGTLDEGPGRVPGALVLMATSQFIDFLD